MARYCFCLFALMLLLQPASAQRNKPQPQLTPEQQELKAKIDRMTAKTEKITFIDSIVVDKDDFLQAYHLNPEAGRIAYYQDVFQTNTQPHALVNINEIGNRCYFSLEDEDGKFRLFTSEVIENKWTSPTPLHGINDDRHFTSISYPYMMGDGETFYFAAKGSESLGGFDIFVTRYDSEDGSFLHPVNIGMPFNSEANDYLYIIDEYSNLGWFATDRRQENGKVCIYTFIPSTTRKTYGAEDYTTEQIASFARIDRIADTWDDTSECDAARQRLQQTIQRLSEKKDDTPQFRFVINDDITYTNLDDFKTDANRQQYQQLTNLQNQYRQLKSALEQARDYYATASQDERVDLRHEILASENKQHDLFVMIHNMEKEIRQKEILFLTKKQ